MSISLLKTANNLNVNYKKFLTILKQGFIANLELCVASQGSLNIKLRFQKRNNIAVITCLLIICRQHGRIIKGRDCDHDGLGSKPTCALLLCPWERHFIVLYSAW